jgi:hypothetical protein
MKLIKIGFTLAFLLFIVGCQTTEVVQTNKPQPSPTVEGKPVSTPENTAIIDLPRLAGKSAAEVEKILGKPLRSKPIKDPLAGEYREYKIPNHPKGLAIRFYGFWS